MMGFLQREKNQCKLCNERFDKQEELVQHAKKVHRQPIMKCRNCGMEFLHEEDRLHHVKHRPNCAYTFEVAAIEEEKKKHQSKRTPWWKLFIAKSIIEAHGGRIWASLPPYHD